MKAETFKVGQIVEYGRHWWINDDLLRELLRLRKKAKTGIYYMKATEQLNELIREIKNASTT